MRFAACTVRDWIRPLMITEIQGRSATSPRISLRRHIGRLRKVQTRTVQTHPRSLPKKPEPEGKSFVDLPIVRRLINIDVRACLLGRLPSVKWAASRFATLYLIRLAWDLAPLVVDYSQTQTKGRAQDSPSVRTSDLPQSLHSGV